jgi:hypothetical protein
MVGRVFHRIPGRRSRGGNVTKQTFTHFLWLAHIAWDDGEVIFLRDQSSAGLYPWGGPLGL